MRQFTKAVLIMAFLSAMSGPVLADEGKGKMDPAWKKISIEEVKNPVTLFEKDWMALSVGKKDHMNAMTVGWGQFGVLWGRPIVTVYVAPDRYTYEFLEKNPYFTLTGLPSEYKEALVYLGTHSGREGDKIKEAGLTPEFTALGNPIFQEGDLAIEAKIIYKEPFKKERLDSKAKSFYEDRKLGLHVAYIGEIINVWKKE